VLSAKPERIHVRFQQYFPFCAFTANRILWSTALIEKTEHLSGLYELTGMHQTHSRPGALFAQQQISRDEHKEQHRDDAIHGEERGIEFRQIVGPDQRMFVQQ
jgi:hypothetical protein